jgi:protein SCO1/2
MVAIVTIAARSGSADTGANAPVKQDGFYGALLPPSFPAVNFALPDQHHQIIRLSDYTGQVVAAVFVYSTCASTCPIVVQQLSQAIDELPHPIAALAISVDPKQDTPSNVQAFLIKQYVTTHLDYLVAPRKVLEPIWKQFGIQPQLKINSSKSDHTVDLVLFDKTGRARVGYQDLGTMDPDAIAADIRTLQAEALPKVLPKRIDL